MKMVKKVLMGLALGAAVFSFVGCGDLLNGVKTKADDDEGAIKGSGQKYTVSYANENANPYRAYKATALKHAGGLIKVTFDSKENLGTSKMGVIFDLKDNATVANAVDFFVIGINPVEGNNNFYVSKMTNIVNIQDEHFGASPNPKNATDPTEVELVKIKKSSNITSVAAVDGKYSYNIFYYLKTDGNYYWAVLDITDTQMKDFNSDSKFKDAAEKVIANDGTYKVLEQGVIKGVYAAAEEGKEATSSYYNDATITSEDGKTKVKITKQNKIAYYAQIAGNSSLNGSWYVPSTTFHEAEDAE